MKMRASGQWEGPVGLISAAGTAAPSELMAAIAAAGDSVKARNGHLLVAAGTRSDDVYVILSGELRVTIFSADGREVIMRHLGPGSFFGDLSAIDGGRRSTSIIAVAESQMIVVRGDIFRALVSATPEAALWFAGHLVAQVRQLTERIFELSTLNVRSRLHCHLLRLCAVAGVTDNQAVIEPSPTHEVLATMIGSHREAVTREISYLASVGVVAQGRRRLEVRDVAALSGMVKRAVGEAAS
jgi:CRP-like cAMP-binding protein